MDLSTKTKDNNICDINLLDTHTHTKFVNTTTRKRVTPELLSIVYLSKEKIPI